MKLTKVQEGLLRGLKDLNTAGVTPTVLQVAAAVEDNPSWGQILYRYKVCKQLIDRGLVGDLAPGKTHALRITRNGLRAIREL